MMTDKNIPKNKEIISNIESARQVVEDSKHHGNVNRQGEKILNKVDDVLEDAQKMVKAKNPNDTLQNIIKESAKLYDDMDQANEKWYSLKNDFKKIESDEVKHQLNNLRINVRILVLELFRSATFRRDVYDLYSLIFMLFTSGASSGTNNPPTNNKQQSGNNASQQQQPQQMVHQMAENMQRMTGGQTKEQVVAQFNKVMKDISTKQSTKDALNSIVNIFSIIRKMLKQVAADAEKAEKEATMNPHLLKILDLTCDLVQSSTNYNTKVLKKKISDLYYSITNDPEIENLVKDVTHYLQEQMKHPDSIGTEEASRKIEEFYNRGRKITEKKSDLTSQFTDIEEEIYKFVSMMNDDTLFYKTRNDINELVSMIMLDSQGNFVIKPEMLRQLKTIFFVTFLQNMRFPLPAFTIDRGDALKVRVSGFAIAFHEMLPHKIIAHNEGDLVLSLKDLEKKGEAPDVKNARQRLSVKLENMNVKIPCADIEFSRDSFPSVDDTGRVAIKVGGNGMDVNISLFVDTTLTSNKVFELETVECVLHDLDVQLSDTCHDTLYNATVKLMKPMFKSAVENQVQENIVSVLDQVNRLFVEQKRFVKKQVERGLEKVTVEHDETERRT